MLALTRVVMKPGASRTRTVSLPICRETASIVSRARSLDSSARTISMSFILWTGLKKCIPATRDGSFNVPAISVIDNADVLLATTAAAGAWASMAANNCTLMSMRSGAVSITRSTPSRAVAMSLVVDSRASEASASVLVALPNSTAFRRIPSTVASALVSCTSDTSYRRVANPADAAACATPWPIVPAPRTAIVRTVISLSTCAAGFGGQACNVFHRLHGVIDFALRIVEVRRQPDAGARPEVHDHTTGDEFLRHVRTIRNVDDHGRASLAVVGRRVQPPASRVRGIHEPACQPERLLPDGRDADFSDDFIARARGVQRGHVRRA